MKKKIQPIIAGVCLGGMLLTGCGKEERQKHPDTGAKESSDVVTTEQNEDVKPVDAPVSDIVSLNLPQLEEREIISVCAVGDGENLYVSTCFEDSELAMPVYEVLRFDYDERTETYKEPVVMEWRNQAVSCVYFTVSPDGSKAYLSMLAEDLDADSSDDYFFLRFASADIQGNQLEDLTFLLRGSEEGNLIISGVDQEENLYYVTEDMETGSLIAKVSNANHSDGGVELFSSDRIQTALDSEQTKDEEKIEEDEEEETGTEQESSTEADVSVKTEDLKENSVLWEDIINIRSIVKAEDGTYYFTAPGPGNGVYMIYSTKEQEDGLFACPSLLPKRINDGVEDKLYCTVSTSGKYLYYVSSKSTINEDGEFCSRTMLYRVEREKLEEPSL